MNIWAISLKTMCQSNTHCVDSKNKIEPYIKKCLADVKKSNKNENINYEIEWLMVDFAIIYEVDSKGKNVWTRAEGRNKTARFGEIHRYGVY